MPRTKKKSKKSKNKSIQQGGQHGENHQRNLPPNSVTHTLSVVTGRGDTTFQKKRAYEGGSDGEPDAAPPSKRQKTVRLPEVIVLDLEQQKLRDEVEAKNPNCYPEITSVPTATLQTQLKLTDLQVLTLHALGSDVPPQGFFVRNRRAIKKVVALMVPGLEKSMFDGSIYNPDQAKGGRNGTDGQVALAGPASRFQPVASANLSPDDYCPSKLLTETLPRSLKSFTDMFSHIWPVVGPGDRKWNRLHSPISAFLSVRLAESYGENKRKGPGPPEEVQGWTNQPVKLADLVADLEALRENGYPIHPALLSNEQDRKLELAKRASQNKTNGWLDLEAICSENKLGLASIGTLILRDAFAIDCEMCKLHDESLALTRISIVNWSGETVLDELVKPEQPIADYVTRFSGITQKMLEPVTTSLKDIQERLPKLLGKNCVLMGHSLESDLAAMQVTHPFIIDTTMLFPHPKGQPYKSKLKWLAEKYLGRKIQEGISGHDSVEDAKAVLDLVKEKCKRGVKWGTPAASTEPIFTRISKLEKDHDHPAYLLTSAVVDWGQPRRGYGAGADVCVACSSDASVVEGIKNVVNGTAKDPKLPGHGVNFVWARMRSLEAKKGWWSDPVGKNEKAKLTKTTNANSYSTTDEYDEPIADTLDSNLTLEEITAMTTKRIKEVHESLPKCTAFIVYSGIGDPRDLKRLLEHKEQYKQEYATMKWSEMTVKWSDDEEQQLKAAWDKARTGVAFVTVK